VANRDNFKEKNIFFLFLLLILSISENLTFALTPGISLSYGRRGDPDHLQGYRIAWQDFWPTLFPQLPINLNAYWDLSFAHWRTTPPKANQPRSITILAAAPIMRLQTREKYFLGKPYLELGIGPSFLSNNHLGHRNLGGQFAFQDLLGVGLSWGTLSIWSLSYHYVHYSNAGFFPPNQGIDVKHLLSVGYQFS
jgi:lipid A 3-O-deacylase